MLAVRGLRNHTTIEIQTLGHPYDLRFGPGTYVDDKAVQRVVTLFGIFRLRGFFESPGR